MKLYASPWKYGLLGGLSDFFKGIGDAQNQQRKFQNDLSLAQVKAQNDRMVKLMEAEARQRSYKVNETDPTTGQAYVASYRNTVNKDGTTTPVLLGRIPADDKMAIQDREDQRAAANRSSIEKVNSNIQNHIDARAAADRAAKANGGAASVTQQGLNTRAVMKATQADMQELHAAHGSDRDALLKAQGIDPKASDAEAQYRAKMKAIHEADIGKASPSASNGDSDDDGSHPQMTASGQPIHYAPDGTPLILGPDGKPTKYVPDANGNSNVPLAMDTANDGSVDPTTSDDTSDGSGNAPVGMGLLASADPTDQSSAPSAAASSSDDDDDDDEGDDNAPPSNQQGLLS